MSSAAWPPGVAIIPIRQEEALELACELQRARRHIDGSPDSRAVLDRVQNVLRAAITLTDVAPFAGRHEHDTPPDQARD